MSRAKGAQQYKHQVTTTVEDWPQELDMAVKKHFASWRVQCETKIARGNGWVSHLRCKNGATLPPALYKRVVAFIAGFMACEASYEEEGHDSIH